MKMKLTSFFNSGLFRLHLIADPIYFSAYYGPNFLAIKSVQVIDADVDCSDFIEVGDIVRDSLFQEVSNGK